MYIMSKDQDLGFLVMTPLDEFEEMNLDNNEGGDAGQGAAQTQSQSNATEGDQGEGEDDSKGAGGAEGGEGTPPDDQGGNPGEHGDPLGQKTEVFSPESVANQLYADGIIQEIPDGVDVEAFDEQAFWSTIKHNLEKTKTEAFQAGAKAQQDNLVGALNQTTQELLAYNLDKPNASEEEIMAFMQAKVRATGIQKLDPEKPGDAERIIREYYSSEDQPWSTAEIADKITKLTELSQLEAEAKVLKPKLDARAEALANQKVADARRIAASEERLADNLKQRVIGLLKTGSIQGVELTQEDASFVYNAVLNQDVDVPVRGGRTMKMGLLEALLYKHRHDTQNGNLENLLLAALVLEKGPKVLEKVFSRKAQHSEAERLIKETKFSNNKKIGAANSSREPGKPGGMFKLRVN